MPVELLLLILFALFAIKHWVCDFILQTPQMIAEKGTYGKLYGIQHAVIHGIGTLAIGLLLSRHIEAVVFVTVLDTLMHYHIDFIKENFVRYKNITKEDSSWWVILGADQLLHTLTYVLIIGILV